MKIFVFVVASLILFGCQSSKKFDDSWPGQMQNMSQDVKKLVPYVYNNKAFNDPKNEPRIQKALNDLAGQAHKVPEEMGKVFFGEDPVVSYTLGNLQGDLTRAAQAFANGQKEYSQGAIKASLSNCFQCHSLTEVGAKGKWDLSGFESLELTPVERVDLLVATRKYNEAISFLEAEIVKPDLLQQNPFLFEVLLRKYLALVVRLQETPGKSLVRLDQVLKDRELPPYMKAQVKAWRDSLSEWEHQKADKNFLKSAEERVRRAKRLQTFAYDHAGDVEYFWATKLLHQGLVKKPNAGDTARAYFLLGQSYEVINDGASYNLHETYYESCITKAPKTKVAKQCYTRLESSLVQGFSGTSGLSLPKEERERLDKLKALL